MGKIVIPFEPRIQQLEIARKLTRNTVVVCHRRFGKTVLAVNLAIKEALTNVNERPRTHYIAPLYSQAKKIAWDYAKHYSHPIPGVKFNEAELRVDYPNGGRLTLLGADNPDSHRGIYSDGAVFDEPAQMSPRMWTEIFRPALADRKGWSLFIGTPQGRNQFYKIYDRAKRGGNWSRFLFRASETGLIPDDELAAIREELTPEEYEQEMECSWEAAIRGAYYGKEMAKADKAGRIRAVPHQPELATWTAWDLGIDDDLSIWCIQLAGGEFHAVNHVSFNGMSLAQVTKELNKLPYNWAGHILPHDVKVRELGTGKSRLEVLESLGLRNIVVAPKLSPEDGIEAVRNILPRMYFDAEQCEYGIESLRQYRSVYDDKKQVMSRQPLHDWTSHAADAMRYFATGYQSGAEDWNQPLDYSMTDRVNI